MCEVCLVQLEVHTILVSLMVLVSVYAKADGSQLAVTTRVKFKS